MNSQIVNSVRLLSALLLLSFSSFSQAQDLTVGSGSGLPGDSVEIPIDFVNFLPVVAMNFDILFDPVQISAVDLSNCDGNLLSPGEVVCTTPAPGVVRIIVYSLDLLELESTELGTVSFTIDPGVQPGTIFLDIDDSPQTFVMSDQDAVSVPPASLLGGEITVGTFDFLEVSPSLVNFGPVDVADPQICQLVTATNTDTGKDALIIKDVFLDGLPFSIGTDNCLGNSLFASESCTIEVCFDPATKGLFSDALTVVSDFNSASAILEGEGVAVNSAFLEVSPSLVNFGPVDVADPQVCQLVSAANSDTGSSSLIIKDVFLDGLPFSIGTDNCLGNSLFGGDSCSVEVCFDPVAPGLFIDALTVVSDVNSASATLEGEGVASDDSNLVISPTSVDFGPLEVGAPGICNVLEASNSGLQAPLTVGSVALKSGVRFSVPTTTCPGVELAPGAICTITLCFSADQEGSFFDDLIVTSSANDVFVPVSGEGVPAVDDSNLVVSPPSVEFGPLEVGAQGVCAVVEATNTGLQSSLLVDSANLASGPPFSRVATSCPGASLAPGASCTVTLCFNPDQEGVFSDQLTFTSSANDVVVPVSGEGLAPPQQGPAISPMVFDFGPNEPDQLPVCSDFVVSNLNTEIDIAVTDVNLEVGEDFTIGQTDCTDATLLPGGTCTVEVCFDTENAGNTSDRLIVSGVDSEPVSAESILSGELQIPPELSVIPDSVDFGLHFQGFSNPSALIEVRNTAPVGAPDLILDQVELSNEAHFELLTGTCTSGVALVAGGDGCTVRVVFSTAAVGTFDAELLVLTLEGLTASAQLSGEVEALDAMALVDRIVFRGPGTFDSLGLSLDAVNGFTKDGMAELIMGAPGDGAVYIVSDILLGLGAFADDPALLSDIAMADGSAGLRLEGEPGQSSVCASPGFGFGFSVAAVSGGTGPTSRAGEGDPIIAIGNPNWGGPGDLDEFDTRGVAYLLQGSRTIENGTVGVDAWLAASDELPSAGVRLVRRASEGACIGAGLAGLGDIDGDGFPDFAVQDSPASISGDVGVQYSYIVHGASDLFELDEIDVENSPDRVTRLAVPFNEGGFFTYLATVSAAGDFNGDGVDDFVVTAPNARFFNMTGETLHAGAAFVLLGSSERLPAELSIPQMIDETTFGDDVRVIFGPQVMADGEGSVIGIDVPRFGASVGSAGDVNGDGIDDLVIGAGQAVNAPGAVFVVYGNDKTAPILIDEIDDTTGRMLMPFASDDGFFGEAVRGTVDVSGDRVNDILIGAPFSDAVGSDDVNAVGTGRVYVVSGASLVSGPGEEALTDVRRVDLDGLLPASVLEDIRFGFALAGFGTDVTSDFGNDFAAAAFRGAATDGGDSGGWVFVTAGEAPPPPRVDAVVPPTGTDQGGTLISIEGADFADGATVDLISGEQSTPCTQVDLVSSTLLTCITPPAAPAAVDVRVTNPEGQIDTLAAGFIFIEVTSLGLTVGESPDDFDLGGRLIQIDVANEGDVDATALLLSVELTGSGQSFESALNLLVDCGVTDDGVRCASAAEPRWNCSIDGPLAMCSQTALGAATSNRLLLLVSGDGAVPVTVSVEAFNAAPAALEAELFQ